MAFEIMRREIEALCSFGKARLSFSEGDESAGLYIYKLCKVQSFPSLVKGIITQNIYIKKEEGGKKKKSIADAWCLQWCICGGSGEALVSRAGWDCLFLYNNL